MRTTIVTVIALFIITILCGCSSKVSKDEVVGNYEVRYPYGTERLELHKDGTYFQSVHIDSGSISKTNRGTWEFDKDESEVILTDALLLDNFFGELDSTWWLPKSGLHIHEARKWFGKIQLCINPDLDLSYEKRSPNER